MLHKGEQKTHVRCKRCDRRRVLPRHPDAYSRMQPVCQGHGCGGRDYRADKWMNNRNTSDRGLRALGCACMGYSFKHRKTSPFCWYRADGSPRLPGDVDFRDHYTTESENDHTFIQEPDRRRHV